MNQIAEELVASKAAMMKRSRTIMRDGDFDEKEYEISKTERKSKAAKKNNNWSFKTVSRNDSCS